MRLAPNPQAQTADLQGISFSRLRLILRACEHEMLRSQRRADDERMSETARQQDALDGRVLKEVVNQLSIYRALID